MAEINGSITNFNPANGASLPAQTQANVDATGKGTIPAAQGGNPKTYKVWMSVGFYNWTNCEIGTATKQDQILTEGLTPKPFTIYSNMNTSTSSGFYQATAELYYQVQKPDGSFDPTLIFLDRKTWQFKIGSPSETKPVAFFCSDVNVPEPKCSAPAPPDGTTKTAPQTISLQGRYKTVGSKLSTRKYKFIFTMVISGAENKTLISEEEAVGVTEGAKLMLHIAKTAGEYNVYATIQARRIATTGSPPNPGCYLTRLLAETSWQFTLENSSSSSSNSSSSSSNSSPRSSSSSSSSSPSSSSPSSSSPSSSSPSSSSPSSSSPSSSSPSSSSPSSSSPSSSSPSSSSPSSSSPSSSSPSSSSPSSSSPSSSSPSSSSPSSSSPSSSSSPPPPSSSSPPPPSSSSPPPPSSSSPPPPSSSSPPPPSSSSPPPPSSSSPPPPSSSSPPPPSSSSPPPPSSSSP
ncbi:hypothetical protein Pan153_17370 [Gimesia panareensis]|uniref:NDT80 domain-containing protein n=1 Tax=Gimesia panareensis TaxID=2527978 RepID=A0A518FL58_9PLAN|nr:hypothetical protein Pan153_17370 [Gimesia panareensis]